MLNIKIISGNIEKALKKLKRKVRNTKQREKLRALKNHIKKTTKKRDEKKVAIYKENLNRENEQ